MAGIKTPNLLIVNLMIRSLQHHATLVCL